MKVTINEKEYTLQKLPVKAAFDLRESWLDGNGNANQSKMYPLVLEHIVVSPKVSMEDFEEMWELDELVTTALIYQYGKKKDLKEIMS